MAYTNYLQRWIMSKRLLIQKARNLYNRGYILQNRQNLYKQPIVFQLFDRHYTSNKNRADKNQHYKIDNNNWFYQGNSLLTKLKLIMFKKVYLIKWYPTVLSLESITKVSKPFTLLPNTQGEIPTAPLYNRAKPYTLPWTQ